MESKMDFLHAAVLFHAARVYIMMRWGISRRTSSGGYSVLPHSSANSCFCDGVTRRSFLRIGALTMGGLGLPSILQAEQQAGTRSHKAVIMVYLSGGLSHHDSFDLKPDAPAEIRGKYHPIDTNVPGLRVGELLPRMART